MQDGAAGQEVWMKETLTQLPADFWSQDRQIYYFKVAGEETHRVGGYYRQSGNFTFITTPKSGHFMPADNFEVSKAYLSDFTKYYALKCDKETCRVNDKMCDAMKQCNQGGTCMDNGQCKCDSMRKGADCSYTAFDAAGGPFTVETNGNQWFYLVHEAGQAEFEISLTSHGAPTYDVYISTGSDA